MKYKYPRTKHMPYSEGATSDDKRFTLDEYLTCFQNKNVVVTEKLDGECTTLYRNYTHARSLDSNNHHSRNWVKRFHSEISHNIPEGWRVCGENLFATHSISYDNLDSYFYGFSIWDDKNYCLDIQQTREWFELLGIIHVPIINEQTLLGNWYDSMLVCANFLISQGKEGIVIRNSDTFHYDDFGINVAKYVRANHVNTDSHWMHSEMKINKLKEGLN